MLQNENNIAPLSPFYALEIQGINRKEISMKGTRGKKVLIVNTASDCGYTAQFAELQKLQGVFDGQLVVIGFPSNDFKEQEKGTDEQIAQFCTAAFGVSFPLARKSIVVKSAGQNEVFFWLTNKAKNGWNDQQPVWNFCKYLVNEEGVLTHFFGPSISPLSATLIAAIKE